MTNKTRLVPGVGPVLKPTGLYLTTRPLADGSTAFYFQPPSRFKKDGWAAVRLWHEVGLALTSAGEAEARCRALAEIFNQWKKGAPGFGPHRIDKLGRPVTGPQKGRKFFPLRGRYLPGQIGAMVADFRGHSVCRACSAKTQQEYRIYLNQLVDKFGDSDWRKLERSELREWVMERAAAAPSGAHQLYRTMRAFFGKMSLVYKSDHPGYIPPDRNPAAKLSIPSPKPQSFPWPRDAVDAFVALADREGEPSIGDAILIMARLGVRKQDWFRWPATIFDRPEISFLQKKTKAANVIPWSILPDVLERVERTRERRCKLAVQPASFFTDRHDRPWVNVRYFWEAFNSLRDLLAEEQPYFDTNYHVGVVPGYPMRLPTSELTVRTLRHTCVTLLADAGVPPDLIGGLTGHTTQEIVVILAHYRRRTADQAKAALVQFLAHQQRARAN